MLNFSAYLQSEDKNMEDKLSKFEIFDLNDSFMNVLAMISAIELIDVIT